MSTEQPNPEGAGEKNQLAQPDADPILGIILEDLNVATKPPEEKPISPAPDPAPEQKPPTEQPPQKAEESPQPKLVLQDPVEVTKRPPIQKIIEDTVRKTVETTKSQQTEPPHPPKSEEAKPSEEESTEGWLPEEVEELRVAEAAARHMGGKYADMPKKVRAFKKAVEDYITSEKPKDPTRTFDENDGEFMEFVERSKPVWSGSDRRIAERRMIVDEATAEATRKAEERIQAQSREIHELKARPAVESGMSAFRGMLKSSLETPMDDSEKEFSEDIKRVHELGDKALEEMPVTASIVTQIERHAELQAAEFIRLANGVVDFDPKNESHLWIGRFVKDQGEAFAKFGGDARFRIDPQTGLKREFVPRSVYHDICTKTPAEAGKYWTFSNDDVLSIMALAARNHAKGQIEQIRSRMSKEGWGRRTEPPKQSSQATPKEPPKPKPAPSPATTPSIAPGAASPGSAPQPGAMSQWELEALGIQKLT